MHWVEALVLVMAFEAAIFCIACILAHFTATDQ
jgi:hypothetical protein